MEEIQDMEKATKGENGSVLKPQMFSLTVPKVSYQTFRWGEFHVVFSILFLKFSLLLLRLFFFKVDGGSNLSIKVSWLQQLLYTNGQFSLSVPFDFPEYITPPGKRFPTKEKIQLNVNSGLAMEVTCNTASHPLKVHLYL